MLGCCVYTYGCCVALLACVDIDVDMFCVSSKKQGKMCTARMRIRHDAKDHVYVKFYPVHNHPWNPNDISHLRQLR